MGCNCKIDLTQKAVRMGRAHYICPVCKEDVTMMLVFLYDAIESAKELRKEKKKRVDKKHKPACDEAV